MKRILAVVLLTAFLFAVGCGPKQEWEEDIEEWEELAEELEDIGEEEEGKQYHLIPGAAYSDALTKEYSRNGVDYNHDEVYEEVTESMMYMRVVVDYLIDFYSMEDKDTIGGGYVDWFSIQISDINDWNYKLDSMQYEQELGYAKDEFDDRETDTPTTFGFTYKGIEWKCEDTDYSEIEGMHTAVNCYTVYKDRLDIRVGSRSADDAEGSGPPLSDSEMQDRVEEKIDLIDFSVIDEVIRLYSDWDFEEYPLR